MGFARICRATGSGQVIADVRQKNVASLPEYDLQADSILWKGSPFATNNMAGPCIPAGEWRDDRSV